MFSITIRQARPPQEPDRGHTARTDWTAGIPYWMDGSSSMSAETTYTPFQGEPDAAIRCGLIVRG